MGCGMSRFNKDEMGPAYHLYYNPLHRRIDDLVPWRHSNVDRSSMSSDIPASTKKLLSDDPDSLTGSDSNGRKSVSVSAAAAPPPVGPATVDKNNNSPSIGHVDAEPIVKLPPVPQQMMKAEGGGGVGRKEEEEEKVVAEGGRKEEEEEMVVVVARGGGEEAKDENEKKGKVVGGENNCELGLRDREDSIFYPGSPSFREYCFSSNNTSIDADHITDDDCGESDVDHELRDSAVVESEKEDNSPSIDPIKKAEEPARTESGKKSRSRRGRRFRVGLPRTGSASMRSIWHVPSCSPHRTSGKAAS